MSQKYGFAQKALLARVYVPNAAYAPGQPLAAGAGDAQAVSASINDIVIPANATRLYAIVEQVGASDAAGNVYATPTINGITYNNAILVLDATGEGAGGYETGASTGAHTLAIGFSWPIINPASAAPLAGIAANKAFVVIGVYYDSPEA